MPGCSCRHSHIRMQWRMPRAGAALSGAAVYRTIWPRHKDNLKVKTQYFKGLLVWITGMVLVSFAVIATKVYL
jgi:hypothetical protein